MTQQEFDKATDHYVDQLSGAYKELLQHQIESGATPLGNYDPGMMRYVMKLEVYAYNVLPPAEKSMEINHGG